MSYKTVDYDPGETIFREGDRGRHMYLVQEGEVEVLEEIGGDEKQVAVLERGDFFGEMALLEEEPRSHAVRARKKVRLIKIDAGGLKKLIQRNPEIAVRMFRKLRRRLSTTEEMLVQAIADSGAAGKGVRLVHALDGAEFPLGDGDETTIGRQDPSQEIRPDIDLTTVDPKFTSSRRHARIVRRGEKYLVGEIQATNGTFVNGRRLEEGELAELSSGDEVAFGVVKMRFVLD